MVFGITDDGEVKGIANPSKTCIDIENRINDSIKPIPVYRMQIDEKSGLIHLIVQEGLHNEHQSILLQYDNAIKMYRRYYKYEQIKGAERETYSIIPEEAFREALANAIVHRTWDVQCNINIAMYHDRIEITSPGGLPKGMNEEEYLRGGISIPRNRIIANVFLRLRLIERFGTGIRRINEEYRCNRIKPTYEVTENSIRITLPAISDNNTLSADEDKVLQLINGRVVSSSSIVESTGFGKSKVVSILNKLADEGYIKTIGNGRGTKYIVQ